MAQVPDGRTRSRLELAGGQALVAYVERFVAAAEEALDGVAAAYVVGSIAAGDASGEASDLDLLLVVEGDPPAATLRAAGERLADLAETCPLRGVEAVVYRRADLVAPEHPLAYALNVNGGRAIPRLVSTGGDPAFWFTLDVAAAAEHALVLVGPPAAALIGTVPEQAVLAALDESLAWHRRQGGRGADAALNACRAWHWLEHGRWLSKTGAGRWAREQAGTSGLAASAEVVAVVAVVDEALAARAAGSDDQVSPTGVEALLDRVARRVAARLAEGG